MTADEKRIIAALLGAPEAGSLTALNELSQRFAWLQAAVEELRLLPLDQWQAEHTRLFINGYPKTPCLPFESIYRHGQMEGPACRELADLYRRAGLSPAGEIPADYLGTMLEFSAWLDSSYETEGAALQAELQEKHFDLWLPNFLDNLLNHAHLKIYRQMAAQLSQL